MKTYILENEYLKATILDYGATLVSLIVKEKDVDVVLGFYDFEKYQHEGEYLGQTIGRVCNRIAKGSFTLNGETYHLPINNGPNSLHGGEIGFNKHEFVLKSKTEKAVSLRTISKDMDQGYPGELTLDVSYQLIENRLEVCFDATTTKDTLASFTNHAFFNLNGQGSVLEHKVWIDAKEIGMVDSQGQTLETRMAVENTPFDFNDEATIECQINQSHSQLTNGNGFDHNYCFAKHGYGLKASLSNEKIKMNVYTDHDHMHFYTGNFLSHQQGKNDIIYAPRDGVCFETQHYPSAIHYPNEVSPILKKGEQYHHLTAFEFNIL
ncbi:MAG: aldose epimerase family protein [Erysipelotrichaceae bacterium]